MLAGLATKLAPEVGSKLVARLALVELALLLAVVVVAAVVLAPAVLVAAQFLCFPRISRMVVSFLVQRFRLELATVQVLE